MREHICSKNGGNIPLHCVYEFTPNLVEDSMGHRNVHGLLDFYLHACICACVHAHARMCAFSHFWTDLLQTWWKHSMGHGMLRVRTVPHVHYAAYAACMCISTSVNGFTPNFIGNIIYPDHDGHVTSLNTRTHTSSLT
jgi:hypothetical protein